MDVTKTGTRNGERGTGNRERESGNECAALTHMRIQNGGQRKRKGNNLGKCGEVKREFLPAMPQMTSSFLLEQIPIGIGQTKHEIALSEKIESVLSYATPIGHYKMQTVHRRPGTKCRLQTTD